MPQKANVLERLSHVATEATGSSTAFGFAVLVIIAWGATGPFFHFSDTWQLVINTGTTVVTFLMVFLIQRSQNKDSHAVHLKLNELVAALEGASNRLIDAEELSEVELDVLRKHYRKLAELTKKGESLTSSHSIEEAARRHALKLKK
jgi:low affinity Fe/Cu permease